MEETTKNKITIFYLDEDEPLYKITKNHYESNGYLTTTHSIKCKLKDLQPTQTSLLIIRPSNKYSIGSAIDFINDVVEKIMEEKVYSRIILLSDGNVYGITENSTIKFSENSQYKPYDDYSSDMIMIENAFISRYKRFSEKFPLIILRICKIISREKIKFLIKKIKNNDTEEFNTLIKHNFIFIDDVFQAIDVVSKSSFVGKKYNITTNESYSYKDILDIIRQIIGEDVKDIKPIYRYYNILNDNLIEHELRWTPLTPVREFMESLIRIENDNN